jgi:hypothetical protein
MLPLALLAAVLATFCDAIHVHTGTLVYPDPWLFNQSFWVFPSFFISFLGMGVAYFLVTKILPDAISHEQSTAPGGFQACIETSTCFLMVFLLSGFGNREPILLTVVFYLSFFLRLAFTYDKLFFFGLAIMLAAAGILGEGTLAVFDMVQYSRSEYRLPEIYNVPWWLGGVYMHGAFALREAMRFFVYKE